jgi:hypothetical protein
MKIEFPLIAIHQVYIKELDFGSSQNGIYLPQWLFEKSKLLEKEKIVLTRENCANRKAEAMRNRTTVPVFSWNKDYVAVSGSAATFLESPGLSCLIAYGRSSDENYIALDFNFPRNNKNNNSADLESKKYGENEFSEVVKKIDREVLAFNLSKLRVEIGDPFCNPHLAEVPLSMLKEIGAPDKIMAAYFSSNSKSFPSLKSYVAPSKKENVAMSGALFSAFPPGDLFSVDIYQSLEGVQLKN